MQIRSWLQILFIIAIAGEAEQKLQVIEPKSLAILFHEDQIEGRVQ